MAAPASFSDQANFLVRQYQHALSSHADSDIVRLQREISALANVILHSAASDSADAKTALSLIGRVTRNTYRSPEASLYLNLKDRAAPPAAPSRPYPYTIQTPFIASYGTSGGPYKMLARLDGEAVWDQIPREILACLGDGLRPENVDVFLINNDSGFGGFEHVVGHYSGHDYAEEEEALLLKFHQWAFPDLPQGGSHKKNLYMGAFPDFGIYTAQHWPAPIGYMKDMEIEAHPDRGGREMLYSPNGAHIAVDTDSPFASLWIAAREGDRCCIAKVLLSLGGYDSSRLFHDYFRLSSSCGSLEEYGRRLTAFAPHIQEYADAKWLPYLAAIDVGDYEEADRIFKTLPRTFQSAFHKQLWIIKGRPEGHGDFGKLCYEESKSLPIELRATPADRIQAARLVQAALVRVFIHEPLELLEIKIPERRAAIEPATRPTATTTHAAAERVIGGAGASALDRAADTHITAARPDPSKMTPAKPILPSPSTAASTSAAARLGTRPEIEECIAALRHLKSTGSSKEDLARILENLDTLTVGRIESGQKASHRLFTLVYECHTMAMEQLELQAPTHPRFGEAAFFGEEGAETHPEVIIMAIDALATELFPST